MNMQSRKIGIHVLEDGCLGTHFCLFYQTKQDLLEILIPYFKAGLENNEYCMWVTSELLPKEEIEIALQKSIPNFEVYVQKGQIEIIPHIQWYLLDNYFDSQRTLNGWVSRLDHATTKEFNGLRATGDTCWITEKSWKNFKDYEATVNNIIGNYPMLAICTYPLEKYKFCELMDVVANHQYVLIKQAGKWKKFTSSKQTKIEQKFRESEENYRTLFELSTDGIAACDLTGTIIDVNKAFLDMLGYSKDELLCINIKKLMPVKWHKMEDDIFVKLLAGEIETAVLEREYVHKNGTIFPVDVKIWVVKDENGVPKKRWGITRNITEHKEIEAAQRLQAEIMANMSEGVYLIGANDAIIRYTNPKFEELFGYESGEMLGKHVSIVNAPTDKSSIETAKTIMAELSRTGVWHGEINNIKKDGTLFWCYASVSVFEHREYGKVFVSVHTDITERKQLEEVKRTQIETVKLKSLGTLAGGIAHDFNNILTGIMGNISLAKSCIEPESKAFERLNVAERASTRAKGLTQQLLTFAQGGLPIKGIVSIEKIIKESAIFSLRGSNVIPEFSIADDLWSAEADGGQLGQVISNLVINAKDAMSLGGVLEIKAKNIILNKNNALHLSAGDYIEIVVKDNGIGISKEHINNIFDPYFTTKKTGSGLGLSMTYSIIKKHSGYIKVDSIENVGTTFYVYLPACKIQLPKKEKPEKNVFVQHKGKILVMDDQETIRELLYNMLKNVGYEVELAPNGDEAVKLYKKAKNLGQLFDVVILDLTVPGGMGGKQALEKLLEIDPQVRAIVSSGYATDPVMADHEKYGFKGRVTKPYNVGQLTKALYNILH